MTSMENTRDDAPRATGIDEGGESRTQWKIRFPCPCFCPESSRDRGSGAVFDNGTAISGLVRSKTWVKRILGSAAVCLALAGLGHAQSPAPRQPHKGAEPVAPLPATPAEQFDACAGIHDRAEREKCIARQTTKGNPATRSAPPPPEGPPNKRGTSPGGSSRTNGE